MANGTLALDTPPATQAADVFSKTNTEMWRALVRAHLQAGHSPETFPFLATDKPSHGTRIYILAKTYRPKGHRPKKYDCPFCRHPDKFWDGRSVLCDDGKIRLIGHDCAAGHVGAAHYRDAEKMFDAVLRRDRFLRIRENLFPITDSLAHEIAAEGRHPTNVNEAMRLPGCVSRLIPKLWEAVLMTAPSGAPLRVERSVVDYVALERRKIKEGDNSPPPMKRQRSDVHAVRDITGMLPGRKPPNTCFDSAAHALRTANVLAIKTTWDDLSPVQFKRAADAYEDAVRSALDNIDSGLAWMRSAALFLSRDNVVGMCRWWNDPDNRLSSIGLLIAISNGVRLERDDGTCAEVKLPRDYRVPQFPSLAKLQAVLENG